MLGSHPPLDMCAYANVLQYCLSAVSVSVAAAENQNGAKQVTSYF